MKEEPVIKPIIDDLKKTHARKAPTPLGRKPIPGEKPEPAEEDQDAGGGYNANGTYPQT